VNIAIVGAGIMGLAAAWALHRRGHAVAVYDQGAVPNPNGASNDRHRLIRHPYGDMDGYCRMAGDAFGAWDRLWSDLGQRLYAETGTLVLSQGGGDWGEQCRASLARCAVPHDVLAPGAVAARYPAVAADKLAYGCWLPSGGMLYADAIVAALARWLAASGVTMHAHQRIAAIDADGGKLSLGGGGTAAADAVVVAAGPWIGEVLPQFAPRVRPSRQVVLYAAAPAAAAWEKMPMVLAIGHDAGFYAVPPRGGRGLKLGDHRFSLSGEPDGDRVARPGEIELVRRACAPWLADFAAYRVLEAKVCFYDATADERFIAQAVGRRTWALSGFSGHGFKFAPLLGERLADAIAGTISGAALSRWAAGQAA
jgi:glycine/D-amino acid oxidase-like deaminating enzyme